MAVAADRGDAAELQSFYEANAEYWHLTHGHAPGPGEAERGFDARPPDDMPYRVAARLLAEASTEGGTMRWVRAEHRTRPGYLLAQTGYMQGAAGIGTFLLRLDAAGQRKGPRVVFPDTPFSR